LRDELVFNAPTLVALPLMTSDERHFLLRKLHSLSGIIPIGLFLMEHMYSNAFALAGREAYGAQVEFLQRIPYSIYLEIGFIWIPILFHALYGFYVMFTGQNNTKHYGHMKNWMYVLQRVSGAFLFFYILFHVTTTWGTRGKGAALYDVVENSLMNPWIFTFYVLGMAATIFHFSNGLWTFSFSWGITVGPRSQRIAGYAFLIFGIILFLTGINSILAFRHQSFTFGM
jgi:succinate dehydrogenase / fumarate reductase, cytochrome b subunit